MGAMAVETSGTCTNCSRSNEELPRRDWVRDGLRALGDVRVAHLVSN